MDGKNANTEITNAAPSLSNPGAMTFLIDNTSEVIDDMTIIAVCADLPPQR